MPMYSGSFAKESGHKLSEKLEYLTRILVSLIVNKATWVWHQKWIEGVVGCITATKYTIGSKSKHYLNNFYATIS